MKQLRRVLARTHALGLAVRLGARKMVLDRENGEVRRELYDLASDPLESRNLLEDGSTTADDLALLLERYPDVQEAQRRRLMEDVPRESNPPIDPERLKKLRALGYLQ